MMFRLACALMKNQQMRILLMLIKWIMLFYFLSSLPPYLQCKYTDILVSVKSWKKKNDEYFF